MDILAEHADKMIVLADKKIAYAGTPRQLFADEEKTVKLGLELPRRLLSADGNGIGNFVLHPLSYMEKWPYGGRRMPEEKNNTDFCSIDKIIHGNYSICGDFILLIYML